MSTAAINQPNRLKLPYVDLQHHTVLEKKAHYFEFHPDHMIYHYECRSEDREDQGDPWEEANTLYHNRLMRHAISAVTMDTMMRKRDNEEDTEIFRINIRSVGERQFYVFTNTRERAELIVSKVWAFALGELFSKEVQA